MATFLLEIGSEELPARFLRKQEQAAKKLITERLDEACIAHGSVSVMSTPRRLAIIVDDVAPTQQTREKIVVGPSVKAAYDASGQPTRALSGFCSSIGASVGDVFVKSTPKGDYVAVRQLTGGRPSLELLSEISPQVILALPFAKKMRWGNHHLPYARPLRWIVALLDDEIVPFSIESIHSGRRTAGQRSHHAQGRDLKDAKEYAGVMSEFGVIVDPETRRAQIVAGGDALAKEHRVVWKDDLLEEVSGLVENPVPLLGSFDDEYLEVPEEVLLTSMQKHQKSFGLVDRGGSLLPNFITVLDGQPRDWEIVRTGWQRVLRARLEDAKFFWNTDVKDNFEHWLKKLENVIFIGPLGSMAARSARLSAITTELAGLFGGVDREEAARAGLLAKADLVSGMVGEFDTLQGVMGGIYAARWGEPKAVADAIREQYLPQGPDSPLPKTRLGAILALADKIDTLCGCFGLKMIPTGEADPNGLRRNALGIIRILLDLGVAVSLRGLFSLSLESYGDQKWKMSRAEILDSLEDFMRGRLRGYFLGLGYDTLLVDAVLDVGSDNPVDAEARLKALSDFSKMPEYRDASRILKRVENILKKQGAPNETWRDEILAEEAEKELAGVLSTTLPRLNDSLERGDYGHALGYLDNLNHPVDKFFEKVMVLCEDNDLRANRLAMLAAIGAAYAKIARFSMLQI